MAVEEISAQVTLENLHARLGRVENTQQQVVTRLGTIEVRLGRIESDVADMKGDLNEVVNGLVVLNRRFDRLDDLLQKR